MDTSDLFTSCKKGDVSRVRYLLEQRDVEINVRDKWDSTPLYYACLCGHEELVSYLLASGAKCEANTFDGERCLYGALSDAIRRVLKEYKQITAKCMKRDYYDVFLQRLLEQGYQSDIVFIVHGKSFCAHRCILSARSVYFAEMFETKWKGKNMIALKHPLINPAAFGSLLQYLYTVSSKPGTCVKVLTIEPPGNCRLQEDLALLADCALPAELRVGFGELPFDSTDNFSSCPDVCFRVADYNFLCHKAFFCGRSDYFKALLEDHFSESEELQTQPTIPVVTLHNISEDIFIRVLYYIYSDDTELSPENAYDVLCVADMYLLPGLKRLCGRTLAQILDEDNVVNIWRIAKLFQLTRLEDQCTEYMAKIIEKLVELEEFAAAVKENAEAVEERQETDSIPLVDDIRFHITSNVQTYSAIEEANQKLEALENLLASIGLEC
ncbi:ankyrin repeat and BTB/POZ domain-containing protein 1 isoform X2 [Caretta caretta]|uniref:ankyrin repeat and BTB/POZ domain-containing protein 1 isoform X2 n=1 Tax=Caretta caretta TaxID=8467 RepID=UPI002096048B|nr:ankyrin repeat and BTB/POZ domain-containing protein 1 isoform X2 [Caretta caretta]